MHRPAEHAFLLLALLVLPKTWSAEAPTGAHPAVAREMAGVWLPDSRRSDRPQWTLNETARKAAERYNAQYGPVDPTIDDANASCIPESMPYPMRLIAQYPFEILFTPGRVTMFFEVPSARASRCWKRCRRRWVVQWATGKATRW
jgi:hypothetical protein